MRRLLRDTWLIAASRLRTTLRAPVFALFALFQPVLWLLLYAPLLDRLGGPGVAAADGVTAFAPGLLLMLALYGTLYAGYSLLAELRAGVLERMAVTPTSRAALALGRVLPEVVTLLAQALLLLGVARLLGLDASPAGTAAALALLALIGVLFASISFALALTIRDETGLAATVNYLNVPMLLLSGIILPFTLAPTWMRAVAALDPLYHAVEATRALLTGPLNTPTITRGFLITTALATLSLSWTVSRFRNVTA